MRGPRRLSAGAIITSLVAAAVFVAAAPANAAVFEVDVREDPTPDGCTAGDCSLREAVLAANAEPGPDTITLAAGSYRLSLEGSDEDAAATGDLDVTDELTIQGTGSPGTTIDAGFPSTATDRILDVRDGSGLTLEGVTLTDGSAPTGGAVRVRVGVPLRVGDATFRGNQATAGPGGAVAVEGGVALYPVDRPHAVVSVELTETVFEDNSATDAGGGLSVQEAQMNIAVVIASSSFIGNHGTDGGALAIQGGASAALDDLAFQGNRGENGGAALIDADSLSLTRSVVTGNTAQAGDGRGGGLHLAGGSGIVEDVLIADNIAIEGGGLVVDGGRIDGNRLTIAGNLAEQRGGGASTRGFSLSDSLVARNRAQAAGGMDIEEAAVLANVTLTGNQATSAGADSAAIDADGTGIELTNVTVADNRSDRGAVAVNGQATARNTILTNTTNVRGGVVANCAGVPPLSAGGNIDDGTSCAFADPTDRSATDPRLAPLFDNGGPTATHGLLEDSPAIDGGVTEGCPLGDQRGVTRPRDGNADEQALCDSGAFEVTAGDDVTDLVLTVDAPSGPVIEGSEVTYRFTVTNRGPGAATQVILVDPLPEGASFRSAVASQGSCEADRDTLVCDLGALADNASATVTLVAVLDDPGTVDNVAAVGVEPPDDDLNLGNNTVTATTEVVAAVLRIAGPDRIRTAVAVSEAAFADRSATAVVLARSDLFPDALAGSPLAASTGGPLLLTDRAALDVRTETELRRILPTGNPVYLLGGPQALRPSVEARIQAMGYTPVRLGGANRFATAALIAERAAPDPTAVLLASGNDFPDALAAGAAAGATKGVVVLTAGSTMPAETRAYLNAHPNAARIAVGGPAAAAEPAAAPVVGADRHATAVAVADRFFENPEFVGIASGSGFADALVGGADSAARGGPILLSDPTRLSTVVSDYLRDNVDTVGQAYLYGGTKALSAEVESAVAAIISGPAHP